MLYMIIERFHEGKIRSVYERFDERGRMMPEGVSYINSWIAQDMKTCYQVMETVSEEKLKEWISKWNDLCDFEIISVITSSEAKAKVFS